MLSLKHLRCWLWMIRTPSFLRSCQHCHFTPGKAKISSATWNSFNSHCISWSVFSFMSNNTLFAQNSITRAAPKVIPPILLCWLMTSETDIGGMAVEVEPSHHYLIMFWYCVTDGSRFVELKLTASTCGAPCFESQTSILNEFWQSSASLFMGQKFFTKQKENWRGQRTCFRRAELECRCLCLVH